ncbi:conserved hypothetical protein [Trichinella spiralis]|uniref:hypothetical protein n=1 Tax=Trichinella spiralis TaxID=6334 RepID=UPI0001EFD0CF|nr:conserved hypothetical protein [Trichinella spiralis]
MLIVQNYSRRPKLWHNSGKCFSKTTEYVDRRSTYQPAALEQKERRSKLYNGKNLHIYICGMWKMKFEFCRKTLGQQLWKIRTTEASRRACDKQCRPMDQ